MRSQLIFLSAKRLVHSKPSLCCASRVALLVLQGFSLGACLGSEPAQINDGGEMAGGPAGSTRDAGIGGQGGGAGGAAGGGRIDAAARPPDAGVPSLDPTIYEIPKGQCYPPCIEDLRRNCPVLTNESPICAEAGTEKFSCYSNGVRIRSYSKLDDDGAIYSVTVRTLPDGKTTCFSQANVKKTTLELLIHNGNGEKVATLSYADEIFVCGLLGKKFRFEPSRTECMAVPNACKQGRCEWIGGD